MPTEPQQDFVSCGLHCVLFYLGIINEKLGLHFSSEGLMYEPRMKETRAIFHKVLKNSNWFVEGKQQMEMIVKLIYGNDAPALLDSKPPALSLHRFQKTVIGAAVIDPILSSKSPQRKSNRIKRSPIEIE